MSGGECSSRWLVDAESDCGIVGAERAAFERHLVTCAECKAYSTLIESTRQRLKELPSGLPDTLTLRRRRRDLLRELNASRLAAAAPRLQRGAAFLLVGLALAAVMLLGIGRYQGVPVTPNWVEVSAGREARWTEQRLNGVDHVILHDGRFQVSIHRPSPKTRVLLTLPDGEIEDLGTVLEVWIESGQTTRVAVQSGEVILRLHRSAEVRLRVGDHWDRGTPMGPALLPVGPEAENGALDVGSAAEPSAARGKPSDAVAPAPGSVVRRRRPPANSSSIPNAIAEDAAYIRLLDLFRTGRRDEAREAAREYLSKYPGGFRRPEVLSINERLERSP